MNSRFLLFLSACGIVVALTAADWCTWRGPRGNGTWDAPALPDQWPKAGLRVAWRVPLGGGYSGISVSNGLVYTLDYTRNPGAKGKRGAEPDGTERVLCFRASDGKLQWSHEYPTTYGDLGGYGNGPRAMPVVHDGLVYTLGAVGHLHCFEATTGKVRWSKDLVREHRAQIPQWGLAASPVIDGPRIIIHAGCEPDGCVQAFDRLTGKELWRSLADPAGYCTPLIAQVPSGRQLLVWTPENIHGLDPETGTRHWSVPYKVTYGVSIASPIYHDGIVFVTGYWEGSKAIKLGSSPRDAEVLWDDNRHLRGLMAQPLHRAGYVYSLDKNEGLVCFELKTGKKIWDDGNRLTPRGRNPHASVVWVGDSDRIAALNAEGELVLASLTPSGYVEQSRTKVVDARVWAHPAFTGSHVFLRTDGAERWDPKGSYELVCIELPPRAP